MPWPKRSLIEKHRDVLSNEEREFSIAPFLVPRFVEVSIDTIIMSRGDLGDMQEILTEQVRKVVKDRFPESDDTYTVQWVE